MLDTCIDDGTYSRNVGTEIKKKGPFKNVGMKIKSKKINIFGRKLKRRWFVPELWDEHKDGREVNATMMMKPNKEL